MAKAMKCDRCGRFFEFYSVVCHDGSTSSGFNTITQGSYSEQDGYYYKKSYDLCQDCCKGFNEWMSKPFRIDEVVL